MEGVATGSSPTFTLLLLLYNAFPASLVGEYIYIINFWPALGGTSRKDS